MTIDTIERKEEADGTQKLTIKGKSLEAVMVERPNQTDFATGLVAAIPLVLTGLPADIVRALFDSICRNNTYIPEDNIQFLQPGSITAPGSIPEPSEIVEIRMELDTLYNSIKKICDIYNLGFRLIREEDTGHLYFEVYTGSDRTTSQTTFPAVVFSSTMDNLSAATELRSTALVKTVAYVFAPNGSAIVFGDGVDETAVGFERKVLIVHADDIDLVAGVDLTAALVQRGKEELASCRSIIAFDAEIPQTGAYNYRQDYFLGDLVEQRSDTGIATNMRVVEQILISDSEGERSYPTLTIDLLITPGSWFSWLSSQVWDDAVGFWDDY
jgi:hypothetical protein